MGECHPGDQQEKRRMDTNAYARDLAQFPRPFHGAIPLRRVEIASSINGSPARWAGPRFSLRPTETGKAYCNFSTAGARFRGRTTQVSF
jgi:hypothetical protein